MLPPRSLLVLSLSLGAVGCAARQKPPTEVADAPPARKAEPATTARASDEAEEAAAPSSFGPLYYGLDSTALAPESLDELRRLADVMKQRPNSRLSIAGHTCELGTEEYNLALGQRRAAAAKEYLVRLGVAPDRISVVSYGEESPAAQGQGEEVWSKNRRSELMLSLSHAAAPRG